MASSAKQFPWISEKTAIRMGDAATAIKNTENAKLSAPFDIGVAFQLGLLYYQTGALANAQAEFERAISINENYSNARYFLGLIQDKKGDRDAALSQFQKIAVLNSENAEIQRIIRNLQGGKSALDGIQPLPEDRPGAPVPERPSSSGIR